ncbi:MAG: DNA polymerase IV [Lachnospiraceae bacterium]|nr:DNA polymerase IV [Lachnospiraceae bacterium]
MNRVILHSDMNCYYASVEHLYHPELKDKPVAVGGDPEKRHGIVLTADYNAKKYGVKTGMTLREAYDLCPQITFVPPHMDRYLRFSRMAREIYADYTDRQEPFGIDESWLDVTESASVRGDGYKIAREISDRIKYELGLTVSIGVSYNKIFAKLGSDYKKPDAITTFYENERETKAWPLPASKLLYVGRSTTRRLKKIGINTIGDIANAEEEILVSHLGKMGSVLKCFALGYDASPVKKEGASAPIKSIGNSITTCRDLLDLEDVKLVLYALSESVSRRLRENGFSCRTVEVHLRDNSLFSFTRQRPLKHPSDITSEIAEAGVGLVRDNYDFSRPLRSIGIRGCDLIEGEYWDQGSIFETPELREKRMLMDRAVDSIRDRFGYYSVQRGLMLNDRGLSALNAREDHIVHPVGYDLSPQP